jgi:hypothetical protein
VEMDALNPPQVPLRNLKVVTPPWLIRFGAELTHLLLEARTLHENSD